MGHRSARVPSRSRPPFLAALLLWPKGDAWGGGGLFATEREIHLNHRAHERKLAEGFKVPHTIAVKSPGDHAGRGEDDPILSWYVTEHRVVDERGAIVLDLGRSDWADWSRAGDLLFARQGSLFRVRVDKRNGLDRPEQLIDPGSLKFETVAAPPEAMKWGGQPVSGKLLPAYRQS